MDKHLEDANRRKVLSTALKAGDFRPAAALVRAEFGARSHRGRVHKENGDLGKHRCESTHELHRRSSSARNGCIAARMRPAAAEPRRYGACVNGSHADQYLQCRNRSLRGTRGPRVVTCSEVWTVPRSSSAE